MDANCFNEEVPSPAVEFRPADYWEWVPYCVDIILFDAGRHEQFMSLLLVCDPVGE